VSGSTLSRRVSEFLGVELFASALVWLIALASYDSADAVWFFNTGGRVPPANFIGRVGAFVAELSYQVLGFASYLGPVVLFVVGWHQFWCRRIEAAYTKLVGVALLFACNASFLSLAFGTLDPARARFRPGGYVGEWLANQLAEYLNRTGSIIFILTALFLSIILSTQFSFGRLFAGLWRRTGELTRRLAGSVREWRMRRQRERQREEVLKKHLERTGASTATAELLARSQPPARSPVERPKKEPVPPRVTPPPAVRAEPAVRKTPPPAAELDLKTAGERRKGSFMLPPIALLDSPRHEQKFDERDLMDGARQLEEKGREFSSRDRSSRSTPGPW